MPLLTVVKPGMLTTVQDLGRKGYQGLGVPVAGPMDWYSHRLANQRVANDLMAAALEVTLIGPELVSDADVVMTVAGAEFAITIDGQPVESGIPFVLRSGSRVRFGARRRGARASLAVKGGFDVPPTLGSRATHLVSAMGPFGRAMRAGDTLPVSKSTDGSSSRHGQPLALPDGGARVRIVPAAHRERFTDDAWSTLTSARFVITPQSNRMGYRLDGPPLEQKGRADMLSEAMPIGALQVPPSGQPILLMADRQTTGGYPTIGNVITADLPIAGQLAPGDWIEFVPCSLAEAIAALRSRENDLASENAGISNAQGTSDS
jgi:antagonist of KipI